MKTELYAIDKHGGPEVLQRVESELPKLADDEVLIAQRAIGLNFIDTYQRSGLYPLPLPSSLGLEGAGVVEAVGEKVKGVKVGEKVVYYRPVPGSYARHVQVKQGHVLKLPPGVPIEAAAASLLKGLTACYLVTRTHVLRAGEPVLIHAAAGGVGLILVQWAKYIGAEVIASVGSEEKADLAREHGCDHVILYRNEDIAQRVREITAGQGVRVVYDSVGQATFNASLQSLSYFGLLVSFGNASGPVESFSLLDLMKHGSAYLTRPILHHHASDLNVYRRMAAQYFDLVALGVIKVNLRQRYSFDEAARAHEDMEAARTMGVSVLLV